MINNIRNCIMSNWKKGSLHCHTLWSDGRSLPEMAIKSYLDDGYDFVCLTDHNTLQNYDDLWIEARFNPDVWPQMLTYEEWDRTQEAVPGLSPMRHVGFHHYVRLRTMEELRKHFQRENEFLLIGGEEITLSAPNEEYGGRDIQCHMNCFNLEEHFTFPKYPNVNELFDAMVNAYEKAAEKATGTTYLMLNHPFWLYWDVDPQLLLDHTTIRVMEVCNSDRDRNAPAAPIMTPRQYWDFVLAHRIDRGQDIVYATATDDAHFYSDDFKRKNGYYGTGFVMVNCPDKFTPDAIGDAILRGDFYASCGVLMDSIEFDKATRTLTVKAQTEPGLKYHIEFITTKRDFDRTIRKEEYIDPEGKFSRRLTVIPEGIGQTVKTVEGAEGSYTMAEDDLYVRAVVYSDRPGRIDNPLFYPANECAWIQPFLP